MWAILWKPNLVYCTWGSISAKLSDHEERSAGSCAYWIYVTCQSNLIPLVYSPGLPGKVTSNSRPQHCPQTAVDSHTWSPHLQYNFQTSRWKSWFITCTKLRRGVVLLEKDKQNRQADFPNRHFTVPSLACHCQQKDKKNDTLKNATPLWSSTGIPIALSRWICMFVCIYLLIWSSEINIALEHEK